MTNTWLTLPVRRLAKAICCPSGEKTGWLSSASLPVSRRATPPETDIDQMSPLQAKAMVFPSGDTEGCASIDMLSRETSYSPEVAADFSAGRAGGAASGEISAAATSQKEGDGDFTRRSKCSKAFR